MVSDGQRQGVAETPPETTLCLPETVASQETRRLYHQKQHTGGDCIIYKISRIPRPGYGAKRLITLKAICGPGDHGAPVITILLENENP
jgi:hypothetical protein